MIYSLYMTIFIVVLIIIAIILLWDIYRQLINLNSNLIVISEKIEEIAESVSILNKDNKEPWI